MNNLFKYQTVVKEINNKVREDKKTIVFACYHSFCVLAKGRWGEHIYLCEGALIVHVGKGITSPIFFSNQTLQ